eukprot:scaffold5444_cov181-Ochromonas_danica.AAC.4
MMLADDEMENEVLTELDHHDINKSGYLQKKTSKGLWVPRFFTTDSRYLRYWHDRDQYDKQAQACEEFDLGEVSAIDKTENKVCKIRFLKNTKFQLLLKAETEGELLEWMEIIRAKIRLYSIDELLADLVGQKVSFRTNTFQTMLLLSEKEQNRWILNRLDEAFECRGDDEYVRKQEMTSRSPRILAHCKNYMQRYSDILKGRTMLELLYIPGIENKRYEAMGEQALCVALELAQKLESLKEYSFVPKSFTNILAASLFTFGDLLSALLNLSLRRVDAFFEVITTLPVELHAKRFSEAPMLIGEFVQLVKDDLITDYLFRLVMDKAATTLLLAFNDHFLEWDISSYTETHFINHVQACDSLQVNVSRTYIDLAVRKVVIADSDIQFTPEQPYLVISSSIQDAVRSTCCTSASRAVRQAVQRLEDNKVYLLEGFLNEYNVSWLDGSLCNAFINNLDQWASFVCAALPERFLFMVYLQVSRLLIRMYIHHMIARHKEKKRHILTEKGVRQISQDLVAIKAWIEDIVKAFSESVLFFGIKYAYHAYDLLRLMLKFRPDVSDTDRRAILGNCSEFINQIKKAIDGDSFSFALPTQDMAMLDDLLPLVGIEHCTGKKWKLCTLADPSSVKLTLSIIVSETCNKALASRKRPGGRSSIHAIRPAPAPTESNNSSRNESPTVSPSSPNADAEIEMEEKKESSAPSPPPVLKPVLVRARSSRPPPPPPPPRPRRATVSVPDGVAASKAQGEKAVSNESSAIQPAKPSKPPRRASSATASALPVVKESKEEQPAVIVKQKEDCASTETKPASTEVTQLEVSAPQSPLKTPPPPKPSRRASASTAKGQVADAKISSDETQMRRSSIAHSRMEPKARTMSPDEALRIMLENAKRTVALQKEEGLVHPV